MVGILSANRSVITCMWEQSVTDSSRLVVVVTIKSTNSGRRQVMLLFFLARASTVKINRF